MKVCSGCGDPKDLSDFSKRGTSKDGYQSQCKLCRAEQAKEYYEANKERVVEQAKEWREANKERSKEWREANKERIKEYYAGYYEANKERCAEQKKEYRKANPDKIRSKSARRKSIKLQAHPPWAATLEKRQIEGIYTLARIQSEATGKKYHVDHIHPLQAPKVVMFEGEMIPLSCGLHVFINLRILEASDNLSKSNKFEPYIESECDFTEPWQVRSDDRALIPTPIDRIPRRYPSALIKPRKSKGLPKGQLSLF